MNIGFCQFVCICCGLFLMDCSIAINYFNDAGGLEIQWWNTYWNPGRSNKPKCLGYARILCVQNLRADALMRFKLFIQDGVAEYIC